MKRLTFAEVRNLCLTSETAFKFHCLALPSHKQCAEELEASQVIAVTVIFHKSLEDLNVKDIREIIDCLICREHQKHGNIRSKIERGWTAEFPNLDFAGKRGRSRYSLTPTSSARSTPVKQLANGQSNSMRQSPLTPESATARMGSPSTHSEDSIPQIFLSPDDSLPVRLQRSLSAPEPSSGPIPIDPLLASVYTAEGQDASPQNTSDLRSDTQLPGDATILQADAVETLSPDDPVANTRARTPSNTRREPRGAARGRALGPSVHQDGFHLGIAHDWAPWTIRSRVLELLHEGLPGPKDQARLYVARINTGSTQRYVKIGKTGRPIETRMKEIRDQHHVDVDDKSVWPTVAMPVAQAMRLEALVHADLAFFQRILCVTKDKRTMHHVEYFELSQQEAWETVNMWLAIMTGPGMRPGEAVSRDFDEGIRKCSTMCENTESLDKDAEAEEWIKLNEDHKLRREVWDQLPRGASWRTYYDDIAQFLAATLWAWFAYTAATLLALVLFLTLLHAI